jgi:uncharacterized membrane protein YdjX (TVP38/TMEM64 family)/uncharacterized protein (DUF1499 family)
MNKTLPRVLLSLLLLTALGAAVMWRDRLDAAGLHAWVEGAGAAGPLVFVGLYALVTVLCLPGSVITLAGGALFGPVWGTLWNLMGATLGAALAFLIARYLGADWVARRAGPRLTRLNEGVTAEGWRFVAFVRLVPVFPFNLLNYALGLTRIPFAAYGLATAVFMLPGAIAYTWLGYAGREALSGGEGLVRNALIALALLAATAFLPRWLRQLRASPVSKPDIAKEKDVSSASCESCVCKPLSRFALVGLTLGLASVATLVAAGLVTRQGGWHFTTGVRVAEWAAYGAALALLLALVGLVQARPGAARRGVIHALLGVLAALPLVALAVQWEYAARSYPAINDISTDTAEAPVFWDTPNPSDYPGGKVAELQRAAYPDLAPLTLALAPELTFEKALAAAKAQGWEIIASVPEEGRLEATSRSRLFGFTDEIAVRVTAADNGAKIDVRSRSRLGQIDRGVNAKRIRTYLAALAERAAASAQ